MSFQLKELLKHKAINEWNLFWLISALISVLIVIAMLRTDLSSGEGGFFHDSARCAQRNFLAIYRLCVIFNAGSVSRRVQSLATA
ncbi:MAG: hypothetical protein GQ538_07030 [Xanthomonadales bacterium]|nr:hypothetical protein [Xanthomonadales bacterium]